MGTFWSQAQAGVLLLLLFLTSAVLQSAAESPGYPPHQGPYYHDHFRYGYDKNPTAIRDPKVRKVYELLYPYYQRPRYRYPFYDHEGNGELLYGYGGRKLYRYTIFKPVEGYLR